MTTYFISPTFHRYLKHTPVLTSLRVYTRCKIYMLAIDNEEPALSITALQILWDKQQRGISSSGKITPYRWRPSVITSLEGHCALFDQGRHILEPSIHHQKFFSTTSHVEPSNFGQALKGPKCFNWIKCSFEKYDKTVILVSSLFPSPVLAYQ